MMRFISALRAWFAQPAHVMSSKESFVAMCTRLLPNHTGVPVCLVEHGETQQQEHRSRLHRLDLPWIAAVARKVKREEVARTPLARQAVDEGWAKLEIRPHPDGSGAGTWDYSSVKDVDDVRAEARKSNKTVHFAITKK